jgi:hypothetical protein
MEFASRRWARVRLGRWLRALPALRGGRAARSGAGLPRVRFVYRELGAATRYRVRNQLEQAEIAGLPVQALSIDEIDQVVDLRSCDLLYLHRLTLWPSTAMLCLAARRRRIPIMIATTAFMIGTTARTGSRARCCGSIARAC